MSPKGLKNIKRIYLLKKFELFIVGLGLMGLGVYTIVEKKIVQDVYISNWDVADKPYIAYLIGSFLFIYGAYIFRYWIKSGKDTRTLREKLKDSIPDMNFFHIIMFLLLSFPVWFFLYALLKS